MSKNELSSEALQVHESAIIVDLHADTPKFMSRGYDIFRRHNTPWPISRFGGHVDLPRMREGNHKAQFFSLWTFPFPRRGCAHEVHRQLDSLEAAQATAPELFKLATSAEELRAGFQSKVRFGLRGIEGGQALEGKVENLESFARRGVRYLGLLHFSANELGSPAKGWGRDDHQGLTHLGNEVVDACSNLGVLVDLAHINRKGFFDAVSRRPGPLIVSHTGVAGVKEHWRNIDDEQIRAVADSGGVIGVIFVPGYIGGDLEAVVDHLLYVMKVGGEDCVALGSDWDGFVGPCKGLEDPSQLPHLTEALLRRGLSPEKVHKLLGGNVLRVLDSLGQSKSL